MAACVSVATSSSSEKSERVWIFNNGSLQSTGFGCKMVLYPKQNATGAPGLSPKKIRTGDDPVIRARCCLYSMTALSSKRMIAGQPAQIRVDPVGVE